jgi:soluble cytochrome b562
MKVPLWKKRSQTGVSQSSSNITAAANSEWTLVGPGQTFLLSELEKAYWAGVKADLENVLLTLQRWEQADLRDVALDDEEDDFVHGFDTFIDQVSQEQRSYAAQYGNNTNQLDSISKFNETDSY